MSEINTNSRSIFRDELILLTQEHCKAAEQEFKADPFRALAKYGYNGSCKDVRCEPWSTEFKSKEERVTKAVEAFLSKPSKPTLWQRIKKFFTR